MNVTVAFVMGLLMASVTVAVAVVADKPLARMVDGFRATVTSAGAPATSVSGCPALATLPSNAVMVVDPGVVPVILTLHEPLEPVVQAAPPEMLTTVPLWEKPTV